MLSVSRTVVREATRVLTAKGLVESRPKRGTVVLPRSSWRILDPDVLTWQTEAGPDVDFLRSVFEIRKIDRAGSGSAGRRASRRPTSWMPSGRRSRRWAARAMSPATSRPTSCITACSSRRPTTTICIQLVGAFGPALQAGLRATIRDTWAWPDFLAFSLPLHRDVLDAVMARDPERASAAMMTLVEGSRRGALEGFRPQQSQ